MEEEVGSARRETELGTLEYFRDDFFPKICMSTSCSLQTFQASALYHEASLKLGKFEGNSWVTCARGTRNRFRAKREHRKRVHGFLPESQGQNLVLTVLYVPYSLDSDTFEEANDIRESL